MIGALVGTLAVGGATDDAIVGGGGSGIATDVVGGGGGADVAATDVDVDEDVPSSALIERNFTIENERSPTMRSPETRRKGRRGLRFLKGSARGSECCEANVSLSIVAAVGGRAICGLLGRMTT